MAGDIAEDARETGKTSPLMAALFLLVAALVAGGSGFAAGTVLFAPMIAADGDVAATAAAETDGAGQDEDGHGGQGHGDGQGAGDGAAAMRGLDLGRLKIVPLDPITTNIGVPSEVWVRMELSLAVDPDEHGDGLAPATIEAIQTDFLAYMRTTRLQALSMPSGFQHLVTDLESRAALRSQGAVRRVYVKALLLE